METIGNIINNRERDVRPPAHELAACVQLVKDEIGFQGNYEWPYWSKRLKGMNYGPLHAFIKEAKNKKSPGAWLSWKLTQIKK